MSEQNDLQKIEKIIDDSIRPHIKRDGGDIQIVSYENNILTINYKGACVGCPMATRGTLQAIQEILREQFNPNIEVQPSS